MAYTYHPDIPNYCQTVCPPHEAEPANLTVYRSTSSLPISEADFLSDIETNKKNRDKSVCEHWGCPVWPSKAAAQHALDLFGWVRKKFLTWLSS